MQTFINILALSSFVVSAGTVAIGICVYQNSDKIIDAATKYAMEQVMEQIALPEVTVPEVPVPEVGAPELPIPPLLI